MKQYFFVILVFFVGHFSQAWDRILIDCSDKRLELKIDVKSDSYDVLLKGHDYGQTPNDSKRKTIFKKINSRINESGEFVLFFADKFSQFDEFFSLKIDDFDPDQLIYDSSDVRYRLYFNAWPNKKVKRARRPLCQVRFVEK
ncbi:MAG: hypothetical protein AAF203_08685 [Pseudomonadota bacterium]